MATYQGTISGIGDSKTRENEITSDNVAVFRDFAIGYNLDTRDAGGVIYNPRHDFYAWVDGTSGEYSNTLHVDGGFAFAYGYFAYIPATSFTFLPPAVEQYHLIYLELDKSVVPNTATIKTKNNQGSSSTTYSTFRRDQLSSVKTGVNQIPLWLIKITSSGIKVENLQGVEGVDLRTRRRTIENVNHSDNATHLYFDGDDKTFSIGENVTCVTPSLTSSKTSQFVVNCEFVQELISQEINR